MESIRYVQQAEVEEAAKLADITFRKEGQRPMAEAFPLIFSGVYEGSVGVYVGEKLVSFMGLVPGQIKIGTATVPCYSLGSVCTDVDHRGKGYAGQLLQKVYEHIEASQGSLLFVSGDRSLYTRQGCVYFGAIQRFKLTPDAVKQLPTLGNRSVREAEERDRLERQRLADASKVQFDRGLYERAVLEEASAQASLAKLEQRIYVAEQDGIIEAYVILAVKGEVESEAMPVVIDWGGDAAATAAMLGSLITELSLPELRMAVPWHETAMLEHLNKIPSTAGNNQGTVKLVNPVRFWDQLCPYFESIDEGALAHIDVLKVKGEDKVVLHVGGKHVILSAAEFTSLLFNPDSDVAPELNDSPWLKKLLPVPLPYTAGLNFI